MQSSRVSATISRMVAMPRPSGPTRSAHAPWNSTSEEALLQSPSLSLRRWMRMALRVPSGRIYSARDIAEDEHYRARGVIEKLRSADGLEVDVPGVMPKLSGNPGAIRHRAPELGEHTDHILADAGLSAAEIAALKEKGVVS